MGISAMMDSGSVLLLISSDLVDANIEILRRQLGACNFGYCFADIIGGYGSYPTEYTGKGCLILIKGASEKIPRNLKKAMESDWDSFRNYANYFGTEKSKKTQSFKRALAKKYARESVTVLLSL